MDCGEFRKPYKLLSSPSMNTFIVMNPVGNSKRIFISSDSRTISCYNSLTSQQTASRSNALDADTIYVIVTLPIANTGG